MTPTDVLIAGALAIVFVVAWFVFGVIDATREDRPTDHPGTATDTARLMAARVRPPRRR